MSNHSNCNNNCICSTYSLTKPILNNYVYIVSTSSLKYSFSLPISFKQDKCEAQTNSLLDSGAYSCFIHHEFVRKLNLKARALQKEIRVYNANAIQNKQGIITHYV